MLYSLIPIAVLILAVVLLRQSNNKLRGEVIFLKDADARHVEDMEFYYTMLEGIHAVWQKRETRVSLWTALTRDQTLKITGMLGLVGLRDEYSQGPVKPMDEERHHEEVQRHEGASAKEELRAILESEDERDRDDLFDTVEIPIEDVEYGYGAFSGVPLDEDSICGFTQEDNPIPQGGATTCNASDNFFG